MLSPTYRIKDLIIKQGAGLTNLVLLFAAYTLDYWSIAERKRFSLCQYIGPANA
jgi:hypothetical protein